MENLLPIFSCIGCYMFHSVPCKMLDCSADICRVGCDLLSYCKVCVMQEYLTKKNCKPSENVFWQPAFILCLNITSSRPYCWYLTKDISGIALGFFNLDPGTLVTAQLALNNFLVGTNIQEWSSRNKSKVAPKLQEMISALMWSLYLISWSPIYQTWLQWLCHLTLLRMIANHQNYSYKWLVVEFLQCCRYYPQKLLYVHSDPIDTKMLKEWPPLHYCQNSFTIPDNWSPSANPYGA